MIKLIQKYTRLYTRYNFKNNQIKGRNAITLRSQIVLANNKQSIIKLQRVDLLIHKTNAAQNLMQSVNLIDVPFIKS